MFPPTDLPHTLHIGHPRYEDPVHGCQYLVPVPPETHGQSREICGSECRRLDAIGTFHTETGDIREELTEEIVRTFIERIEIEEKVLPENKQIAGKNVPYTQKITIYYRFIGNIQENIVNRQDMAS